MFKHITVVLSVLLSLSLIAGTFPSETIRWTGFKHPVKFDSISVEEGLSQSSVLCIVQDSKGFMWFGTEDGLNKYDGYRFTPYKPEPRNPHSLSGNIIFAVHEDSQKRLWIGTNGGGLSRFQHETEQFVHYRHNPEDPAGLSSDTVNCIYEDRSGNLWVGTGGGGVNKLSLSTGSSFTHYRHHPGNPRSLSSDVVNCIYEDREGNLWIGTGGQGLNKLDYKDRGNPNPDFTRYKANPGDPDSIGLDNVHAIDEDSHGTPWIGTQDGLYELNRETETFKRCPVDNNNPKCVTHCYVRRIYKDRAGILWIGTDGGGLDKMVPGETKGTAPSFVHYSYDPNNPDGLNNNAVESIYEDRSGVLWIGTYRGGLNKLVLRDNQGVNREMEPFAHYRSIPNNPDSLSHNAVNAICEDRDGTLWVGTDGGGLNRVSPGEKEGEPLTFHHYSSEPGNPNGLNDNIVLSICEDHDGTLWIGTYTGGLNKMIKKKEPGKNVSYSFLHYKTEPNNPRSPGSDFIMTLFTDRSGTLWAGTIGGGLNRMDRSDHENGTFTRFQLVPGDDRSLSDNNVFAVYEDRSGNLWIGTLGGLNRFVPPPDKNGTGTFTRYRNDPQNPNTLSHNFVRVIHEDREGVLWIGTNGGGLNKFLPGETNTPPSFFNYSEKDGLPNNVIVGILEDDRGNLWLSTNKGLSKFNPETGEFKNYGKRDGLQGDEFNRGAFFKSRSGEMFFGGNNGFNIFHPGGINENTHAPPIVLTDFQLFNKSIPTGKTDNGRTLLKKHIAETRELELSHRDSVFSFQFAALHYVNPSGNRYAYKMEGLESDWNDVGDRRFVTYTTLPPGDYVFRVKGCNSDGVWNEEGVSLIITVTPPFWRTWWFYGLVALAILLTVLGIHYYRVRQIVTKMRKKYEKTHISSEKAKEYLNVLLNYMKIGKPYLDPHLTLHKLAKLVVIPHHYLSQIINDKLNKIFFDFINQYRIEDALKKLSHPGEDRKTIHEVAQEVGFNSQSAFNRAFKKHTCKTPSDFITECRIEQAKRKLTDPGEKQTPIHRLAREVGFSSVSSFNRAFKNVTGKTPSQFRKKGK